MNPIKKLASQTAVYGLSHIAGRLLTFLFLPLYTGIFSTSDYGILSLLLVAVAFMNIVFTYGMETAYFRFVTKESSAAKSYPTALTSLISSSLIFAIILYFLDEQIAAYFGISEKLNYIHWFIGIIILDTLSIIPLAKLRFENKVYSYAGIKLLNVAIIVFFNLAFLLPMIPELGIITKFLPFKYDHYIGIGYIILANLIASGVVFIILLPGIIRTKWSFDLNIWKEMMLFGGPLILVGLAGMINELMDRILLKELLPGDTDFVNGEIGIYSACYKLAMLVALVNTAFRQAAEPFFFAQEKERGAKKSYADILKYYVIVCCFVSLAILFFVDDIASLMISEKYHAGLKIVPILLLANIFLGIYYNLSVWYKLTEKTLYGMYIAISGAFVTFILNFLMIPYIGYMGSAIATLACYFIMLNLSFFIGKRHYPIPYEATRISAYIFLAIGLYWLNSTLSLEGWLYWITNLLMLCTFLIPILIIERPNNSLNSPRI